MKKNHRKLNTLIITVGNSDVQTSEPQLFPPEIKTFKNRYIKNSYLFSMPMLTGKTILKNPEFFMPHLQFPIIDNCLTFLFKEFPFINNKNLNIFLVSTRQPASNPHSHRDSFEFANLIIYYLHKKLALPKDNLHNVVIRNENLIHYDNMFSWFQKKFNKNNIQGNVFLLPQGGIDAINFNLMLYCIRKYPKLIQLYVDENNQVTILKFPHQIRYYSFIQPLLDKYHYEQLANIQWLNDELKNLFTFLKAKFNNLSLSPDNLPDDLPDSLTQKLHISDRFFWLDVYLFIAFYNQQIELAVLTYFVIYEHTVNMEFFSVLKNKYGFSLPAGYDFKTIWETNYNFFAAQKKVPPNYPNLLPVFQDLIKTDPELKLKILNLKLKTALIESQNRRFPIKRIIKDSRNLFVHELTGVTENDKNYILNLIKKYLKNKVNEIKNFLHEINDYAAIKILQ